MHPIIPELRTVNVIRYITPLREGGSLPAIAEADDGFTYVLKFRGAGQGVKALIAELLGGEIARILGLKIPELVFACLDPAFGRTEPDEEIQDLLRFSEGLNLALHFLSGAFTYDPNVTKAEARLASKIVWLDALIMNVDRTAKNTNMLVWRNELWLIDHGASFYFHHNWDSWREQARKPFVQIKDHVLLPFASELEWADREMKNLLTPEAIQSVAGLIPAEWLESMEPKQVPGEEKKEIYIQFLQSRLQHSSLFVNEAQNARKAII